MVCTALQAAVRIHRWGRNSKEARQLLISICGLLRSASGASHRDSLQRLVLLEKPLLFTLENLAGKRRTRRREGEEKK